VSENTGLVCLNSRGRALVVVGPFASDKAAIDFYYDTASFAYHGYTLVSMLTPEEYSAPAVPTTNPKETA
jgi:hypothetical protein